MCHTELYHALRCAKCKAVIELRQSRNQQCPKMQAQPYRLYCHEQNWAFKHTINGETVEFQPEAYCVDCQPLHFRQKLEIASMEELVKDAGNRLKIIKSQSMFKPTKRLTTRLKTKSKHRVLFNNHRQPEGESDSDRLAEATTKIRALCSNHGNRSSSGKITKTPRPSLRKPMTLASKKVVTSSTRRPGLLGDLLSSLEYTKGESYRKKFDTLRFECEQVLGGRQPSSHGLLSGDMESLNFKVTQQG